MTHLQPAIIGMGFSKKSTAINLKETLDYFLQQHQYTLITLALAAFKQQDQNTLQLQTLIDAPVHYISYETLKNLQPQCQSYSPMAAQHIGLGAVAEACALAMMGQNDHLLIPKIIYNKVSFSVALKGDPS